ncbi:MAG TPA: hypothetical protein VM778_01995 [Gemmatimonadota bacterium]|nr:hypothetical protein [Gemmatimonadota bacterium]
MRTLATFALALLTACGGAEEENPVPADEAESSAAPAELDLATLVSDIRTGVADLPARVASDPAGARQTVVHLYVTRQEEIERRWGPNGSEGRSPELAAAVEEAETRFHHLMEILAATPPADSAAVAEAVAVLDAGQADVLAAAP